MSTFVWAIKDPAGRIIPESVNFIRQESWAVLSLKLINSKTQSCPSRTQLMRMGYKGFLVKMIELSPAEKLRIQRSKEWA